MSISDFTLTSPRKGALKNNNRSITYDEEFEKFLNDTSESEVSTNRYVKQSNEKPWWMKDDDNDELENSKTKKSFIKQQPLPQSQSPSKLLSLSNKKLSTTLESDEYVPDKKEDPVPMPRLSIDNSSYSINNRLDESTKRTKSISDDGIKDEDDENENESSTEQALSSPESKQSVVERLKPTILATQTKSELETNTELTKTASNNEFGTNLLSKVQFMDTMTSGEAAGNNTLKQTNKTTQRQVQINDSRTLNLNTQTRRDFDDIEQVYRNLAIYTDSGLNTLIRTNQPTADNTVEHLNETLEHKNHYQTIKLSTNKETIESDFGLKAVHAITAELENRALEQFLKEFEKKSNYKDKKTIHLNDSMRSSVRESSSNDKYNHIKGTGYGSSWSPKNYIGHFHRESEPIERQSRSKSKPKSALKQRTQTIDKRTPSTNSRNQSETRILNDNDFYVKGLKHQIVERETDHEKHIKEIRFEYEQQIKELRERNNELSNQLKEKISLQISPISDQTLQLEPNEKLKEQENLIKGYQQENERLYSDLKRLKEKNKLEIQNINEQISNMQFNFIQDKIKLENQIKTAPIELISKPIVVEEVKQTKFIDQQNQINELNDSNHKCQEIIKILTEKLNYYEKNQHQIDMDMKLIDLKNKEIKKLNDKLKQLEMGKTPIDCLKQIKQLKSQIKEMESLIKRLKQPTQSDQSNAVNISINYYEQKIQDLEAELKEKDLGLDRLNRFWEQKFSLYKQVNTSKSPTSRYRLPKSPTRDILDKKLNEFESNYVNKIQTLENLTQNLRKIIKELEVRLDEKQTELNQIKSAKDSEIETLKRSLELSKAKQVKIYSPNEFVQSPEPQIKTIINTDEIESLKTKLKYAQNELRLSNKEYEIELKQIKQIYENKMNETSKKHRFEIDKLLRVFTGSNPHPDYSDISDEFPFNDPIQMRLLLNARDKHSEMRQTIEKQKQLLAKLNNHCNELNVYKDKCIYLEEENMKLSKQIEELKLEEEFLKSVGDASETKHYEFLKEKIKRLENNISKREKDLNGVLKTDQFSDTISATGYNLKLNELKKFYDHQLELKNKELTKFRLEFDAMIQLLHSL